MINPEELAICRRRGHQVNEIGLTAVWTQCKWCKIETVVEREDDPPAEERSRVAIALRKAQKFLNKEGPS